MKALEERIIKDGVVAPGNILKVGSFLNQQIDPELLMSMGAEIGRLFAADGVTKILTLESSGIPVAFAAAASMKIPMVFAKKNRTSNIAGSCYLAKVQSYTHGTCYDIFVDSAFISSCDRVLIVDDFLALGNAVLGLKTLVAQANAKLVGVAVAVEKGFQGAGDALRADGCRVEALALVDSMEDGKLVFRKN